MYLDANIVVGVIISKHRLYASVAELIGELLANGAAIVVSVLTIQESLWALARLSYYELAGQPSNAHFSKSIYLRWCERIFDNYAERMHAVSSMFEDWVEAGVTLGVIPKTDPLFLEASSLTPHYMRQLRLAPSDAAHLALAQLHANTFVTGDGDFKRAADVPALDNLAIVHVAG